MSGSCSCLLAVFIIVSSFSFCTSSSPLIAICATIYTSLAAWNVRKHTCIHTGHKLTLFISGRKTYLYNSRTNACHSRSSSAEDDHWRFRDLRRQSRSTGIIFADVRTYIGRGKNPTKHQAWPENGAIQTNKKVVIRREREVDEHADENEGSCVMARDASGGQTRRNR